MNSLTRHDNQRSSAMYDDKPDLTKDEWISTLKLSTRWFFNDLRKLALSHLSAIKMEGIERICLAKEYRVSNWLQEGYAQIINRLIRSADNDAHPFHRQEVRPLTAEEGTKIGMEVALTLSGLAISLLRTRFPTRQEMDFGVDLGIQIKFCSEIEAIRAEEKCFLTEKDVKKTHRHRQLEAEELRKLVEEETVIEKELNEREREKKKKRRVYDEARLERELKEQKREAEEREKKEQENKRVEEEAKAIDKAASDRAKADWDKRERQRPV